MGLFLCKTVKRKWTGCQRTTLLTEAQGPITVNYLHAVDEILLLLYLTLNTSGVRRVDTVVAPLHPTLSRNHTVSTVTGYLDMACGNYHGERIKDGRRVLRPLVYEVRTECNAFAGQSEQLIVNSCEMSRVTSLLQETECITTAKLQKNHAIEPTANRLNSSHPWRCVT